VYVFVELGHLDFSQLLVDQFESHVSLLYDVEEVLLRLKQRHKYLFILRLLVLR